LLLQFFYLLALNFSALFESLYHLLPRLIICTD